jgi:hypothetical protein
VIRTALTGHPRKQTPGLAFQNLAWLAAPLLCSQFHDGCVLPCQSPGQVDCACLCTIVELSGAWIFHVTHCASG